jgi:hypothetical protein
VVDIAKDVFTYSDATRSRNRPARGGHCARAALGGGYYFRHALSQLSNLLREVEPEAALLVFQYGNYSVEFVVLSHIVGSHR